MKNCYSGVYHRIIPIGIIRVPAKLYWWFSQLQLTTKTNSNLMQQVEFDRSILAGSWIASVNQETIFAVDLNF